jgi:hypothetical protein
MRLLGAEVLYVVDGRAKIVLALADQRMNSRESAGAVLGNLSQNPWRAPRGHGPRARCASVDAEGAPVAKSLGTVKFLARVDAAHRL